MNLPTLFRPPLVWLVVAEAALVAVLCVVTWQVWQQRVAPVAAALAPPVSAPPPRAQVRASPPLSPPPAVPRAGPTPGIRTDPDFLAREMAELNRVEATFEDLEWRVTSAFADAIQRYVTAVVLPSIERSERGRR
jgi:hypothetical protein